MQICICVNSCLNAECERIKLSAIELINSHSKFAAHLLPLVSYILFTVPLKLYHIKEKCDMTVIILSHYL